MILLRLEPDMDLMAEMEAIDVEGAVVSGIGSLHGVRIRTADESILKLEGPLEIISLQGTLTGDGVHIHIAVADSSGRVFGGHLRGCCRVRTTVELAVIPYRGKLRRVLDDRTGYSELVVLD
ncbi:PPC domain-containing DNA-binding protein [Methanothermobacter sp.]